MPRTPKIGNTELSVTITYSAPDGKIEIVNPSVDGVGVPVPLFCLLMEKLTEAKNEYNESLEK